jgi:hypothetical protein
LYGKEDEHAVAQVKKLYLDIGTFPLYHPALARRFSFFFYFVARLFLVGLKEVFDKQEEDSLSRINEMIRKNADIVPPVVFEGILKKVNLSLSLALSLALIFVPLLDSPP